MRKQFAPYPDSPIEPVTEILHGVQVTDLYRWLEDQNSSRTRDWLRNQAAYTRNHLDGIPGRERLKRRVHELFSVDAIDMPLKVGNRIVFLKHGANFEQPVLMMREGLDGGDTTLVDPAIHFHGTSHSIGILSASENAGLLAFSFRQGGEDFYGIRFFDLHRQEILPDSLPRGICRGLVFAEDGSEFFYCHDPAEGVGRDRAAYRHKFGTSSAEDVEIFAAEPDPRVRLTMVGSARTPYLGFALSRIEATRTHELYVQRKDRHVPTRLVLAGVSGRLVPRFSGDFLVCLLLSGHDNGQIICLNLERSDAHWCTVVPATTARIDDFVVCGRTLFVRTVQDAECRVAMYDVTGLPMGLLPAPTQGTTRLFRCDPEGDLVFYRFSSFVHPPSIYCYNPQTKVNRLWSSSQVPIDTSSLVVSKARCISRDTTEIPIHLLSHERWTDLPSTTALLTAYGGFGNSRTPEFSILGCLLAEMGCLFAVASVRGGSEFGEQWHAAAKGHNRQRAIDDFLAASQWLIEHGHSSPERLATAGGSNGGLLVAAATTQRPDLFRATLCLGPLLDMLRYHLFDSARDWIEEFGSPDNSEDFPSLLAYSPYHRVKDNTAYPAVMLVSGDSDSRCNPMHVRKMTARLQAATSSGHPILLQYREECGHVPVQPLQARIELMTDRLCFLCSELNIQT